MRGVRSPHGTDGGTRCHDLLHVEAIRISRDRPGGDAPEAEPDQHHWLIDDSFSAHRILYRFCQRGVAAVAHRMYIGGQIVRRPPCNRIPTLSTRDLHCVPLDPVRANNLRDPDVSEVLLPDGVDLTGTRKKRLKVCRNDVAVRVCLQCRVESTFRCEHGVFGPLGPLFRTDQTFEKGVLPVLEAPQSLSARDEGRK